MKKFQFYVGLMWRPVLGVVIITLLLFGLLIYHLDSHVAYSSAEIQQGQVVVSVTEIAKNPVNLPVRLIQYTAHKVYNPSLVSLRFISVLFGMLSILCFYLVSRSWHTTRIAIMATAMYATSTWFLITTRLATTDVILTLIPALLLARIWLAATYKLKLSVLTTLLLAVCFLYIPGGIWFILIGLLWRFKRLYSEARAVPAWFLLVSLLLCGLLVLPLIVASIQDITMLTSIAGLGTTVPKPLDYLQNIGDVGIALFAHAEIIPTFSLGRSALLDGFSIVMFVIGVYSYCKRFKLDRSKLLIGGTILSILLVGFGSYVSMAILLPFAYLLIAAGLAWMLQQWFTVFPKNPLARNIGLGLVIIAVCVSVFYNLTRYYIAWPHTAGTKQLYNQKQ